MWWVKVEVCSLKSSRISNLPKKKTKVEKSESLSMVIEKCFRKEGAEAVLISPK